MLELRDLQFLSALARHRHFAKAAQECGVSQPAFSMRIRKLEDRLGTSIVKRANRFQGFTPEGESIVRHARRVLDEVKLLQQEVRSARGDITGALTLGVIPTAVASAAQLANRLAQIHPGIVMRIDTASSLAIQQGIEDGRFDAGITYRDGVSNDLLMVDGLYDEHYVLLAPAALAPRDSGSITWAEAADLPLCLLEPGMRNRRILDRIFLEVGATPRIISETNGLTAAVVMAAEGLAATVLPEVLARTLGGFDTTICLPLVDPVVEKSVCLVSPARAPQLPTVAALRNMVLADAQ